jgi:membrane associated rhomboid family serine protease
VIPLRDENPTRRRAYVTVALILLNIGVYFFWQPTGSSGEFEYGHAVVPCELTTQEPLSLVEIQTGVCVDGDGLPRPFADKNVFVAIVVSLFLHGSVVHLGGNMLFLWVFGNNIEDRLGHLRYIAFYLASGVVATLAHVAIQSSSTVPLVGASGAIAGIMGAYLLWYPNARVLTWAFFVPAVIRAKWLLIYWFVSQFFVNPNEGVAWAAHVGGFIAGLLLALVL